MHTGRRGRSGWDSANGRCGFLCDRYGADGGFGARGSRRSPRYAELGERYRHHYFKQQDSISLFDGVLDMLVKLKDRGHALAVATGKSRRGLNEALQAVELQGLFAASRTADETAGKPHPMMLHELMAEMNTVPERTLMIGDTTHDLQMALNAGCASLGVSYGAHEPTDFQSFRPEAVVHSVAELQTWLLANA